MSLKGTIITPSDIEPHVARGLVAQARAEKKTGHDKLVEYCVRHNERYRIVAHDSEKGPLIREELDERALRKMSFEGRMLATMMLHQSKEVRSEVLGVFDSKGNFLYPWPVDE